MLGKKLLDKTKKLISENHADFKGENNPHSILKESQVHCIHKLIKLGFKNSEIMKIYNISGSQISNIKYGRIWNDIYKYYHKGEIENDR